MLVLFGPIREAERVFDSDYYRLCSSGSLLQSALHDLRKLLLQNGYPQGIFNYHSLLRRGSKVFFFFSGGVDPLSNVSAGTELQATAESAGASARYHTQDGRHPGETIFCALLPGVACTPCVTVKMAGKILRVNDV